MSTFPKAAKNKLGYSIQEVDSLISRARDQYSNGSAHVLNWRELTSNGFTLEKGGYQPDSVDLAIDKLQDTFASRELSVQVNNETALRTLLLVRIARPKGKRFAKVAVMAFGYSRKQVDALLTVVGEYLEGGEKLPIEDVRGLKFKLQRGGYIESQVDSFIDRVVEQIQTDRFAQPYVAPVVSASNGYPSYSEPTSSGYEAY